MPKPAINLCVNNDKPWTGRMAVLGLGLLMIMPVSFTALDYLVPKTPGLGQIASTRAGWYLRSGQWHADVRTLAAAFEFVMDLSPDAPAGTNSPINQLASTSRPVGSNPPAMTHVEVGSHHPPQQLTDAPTGIATYWSEDDNRMGSGEIIIRVDEDGRDIGHPRAVQRPDCKIVTISYYRDRLKV